MNRKNKLFLGATALLLVTLVGVAWAYTPYKIYNRPNPLMDYAPQEIGIGDYLYPSLDEDDCRICHGTSLADRHHFSQIALGGMCTPCHAITTTPPYVAVTNDCKTSGCHSGADLGPLDQLGTAPNGGHHWTQEAYSDQCLACHSPAVLDRVVDDEYVPFAMYPPTIVTPKPYSCENCHWEQPIIANTVGWVNGDPQGNNPYYTGGPVGDLTDAGHPSTFDHNDIYSAYQMDGTTAGYWNDYFEYGKKIESNYDTHHMNFTGDYVSTDCERCHSMDPNHPDYTPSNPELIRYCETCHDIATLHAIQPHVGTGGTANPPAVNGWEAVGFHLPDASNIDTTDLAPTTYRQFLANEQCWGCHGDDVYDPRINDIPAPPVDNPIITNNAPGIVACDGVITLTGNHFGDEKTAQRDVKIKLSTSSTWNAMPIVSWTSTQIEFKIPCGVYATGNYLIAVDTETATPSNTVPMILSDGASLTSISPTTGPCRQIVTVNGPGDFGTVQDGVIGGSGVYKVVQVVSSSGMYQATVYGAWSNTSFAFRMGDLFEDTNQNWVRDGGEPLLKQCEDLAVGTYSVYVRTLFYDDSGPAGFDAGDTVHQVTVSEPGYFVLDSIPAVYLVLPQQIERSHYCEIMGDATGNEDTICDGGEPCYIQNGVARIYGWGFGTEQGTSQLYIGTGPMYAADAGLALNRTVWSNLLIKAAIDVPAGAKGLQLYLWVDKGGGVKTNAAFGYPGIFILNQETCN